MTTKSIIATDHNIIYLSESEAEIARHFRVEERIEAGVGVGQHVGQDLAQVDHQSISDRRSDVHNPRRRCTTVNVSGGQSLFRVFSV